MTEEEKNDQQAGEEAAEAPEAPEAESPDASRQDEGAAAEEGPPAEEPAATEEPAAEEEPPPSEEAPAPAEPEPEPAAQEEPTEEEPAEVETLTPRERRKLERSRHRGEAQPARSPEDRVRERADRRKRNAAERRAWRARSRERSKAEPSGEPTPPAEKGTGKAKVRLGVVVSDKADKTITVRIDTQRAHRMYGKVVRNSSTLHAHDESNDAHVGDTVRVVETRPLSRTKRWRLVEVLERAR